MKKFMTVALATAMTAALACTAFADDSAVATLSINYAGWAGSMTSEEVTVTGNGTYTISASADETQVLEAFNALQIENGEEIFGHNYFVVIDSIEIDGVAVELQGSSYTCSADGEGVTTRVNIYNEWNSPDELNEVNAKKGYADQRVATVKGDETATLIDKSYKEEGIKSIKVTFTVSGIGSTETGDSTPIIYLAAIVGIAGIAMVASKKRA